MTDCCFRFSRFDPSLRQRDGRYPDGTWTELFELIDRFGDVAEALAVYEPVEDAYADAVIAVLELHHVSSVQLVDVERNALVGRLLVEEGADVPLPEALPESLDVDLLAPIVRSGLRSQLWCQIRSPRVDVTFGQDLYVYVRAQGRCDTAKALVRGLGLFVDDAAYPVD